MPCCLVAMERNEARTVYVLCCQFDVNEPHLYWHLPVDVRPVSYVAYSENTVDGTERRYDFKSTVVFVRYPVQKLLVKAYSIHNWCTTRNKRH
jgi:hypothetical protein